MTVRGALSRHPGLAMPLLLAGCAGNPSVLNPSGPAAGALSQPTWMFVSVCGVIFVLVTACLLAAIQRGRHRAAAEGVAPRLQHGPERGRWRIVTSALIASALVLSVFVAFSYATDRSLIALQTEPTVKVKLTAHQWWWEIRYDDPSAARSFTTANELHLPLNEPVRIEVTSPDVIHSLWLPNLNGKQDVIPGRSNGLWVTVTKAGTWLGRCAEFCGPQHANMQILVVAEPRGEFEAWQTAQASPSVSPETDQQKRGQAVFASGPCALCHVIRGSPASGYSATAPDLTHLASRQTIGAGTLANTKANLGGWILDPQSLKPGVRMPVNALPPDQFQDLLAYLESLR
jgi:cytochrome c oxidase subunit 2